MDAKDLTIGEKRVRTEFNPGNNDKVQNIKEKFAHLINEVNELPSPADTDAGRLKALSMTALEESAMWAVKAATV